MTRLDPFRVMGCALSLASLVIVLGAFIAAVLLADAALNGRRS